MSKFSNRLSFPLSVVEQAARVAAFDAIDARTAAASARRSKQVSPDELNALQARAKTTGNLARELAALARGGR